MTAPRRNVPVRALITPPGVIFFLVVIYAATTWQGVVTVAAWAVFAGAIIEGFAVSIALMALFRSVSTRTVVNIAATLIGGLGLLCGIVALVAISRGM